MQDLNTIPSVGTFGEVARNANTNFSLLKIAVDLLEHSIEHSRGYFTSASALTTAFPSPAVGDWAIVEVSGSPVIYKCSTRGTWSNSGTQWAGGSVNLAEYAQKTELYNSGYYICETAAATAAKAVSASGYLLKTGGNIRIKMSYANTAANATLNIGGTGAKPLYYNDARASASNSWEAEETIVVYYDGTNYIASNAKGGGGKFATGEVVGTIGIEDKPIPGSEKLPKGGGVFNEIYDHTEGKERRFTTMASINNLSISNGQFSDISNNLFFVNYLPCRRGEVFEVEFTPTSKGTATNSGMYIGFCTAKPAAGVSYTNLFNKSSQTLTADVLVTARVIVPDDGYVVVKFVKGGSSSNIYWSHLRLFRYYDMESTNGYLNAGEITGAFTSNLCLYADETNPSTFGSTYVPNNSNYAVSDYIDISEFRWLSLRNATTIASFVLGKISGSVFYDENKQPLRAATLIQCQQYIRSSASYGTILVEVPSGAKYIRIAANNLAQTRSFTAYAKKKVNSLPSLSQNVSIKQFMTMAGTLSVSTGGYTTTSSTYIKRGHTPRFIRLNGETVIMERNLIGVVTYYDKNQAYLGNESFDTTESDFTLSPLAGSALFRVGINGNSPSLPCSIKISGGWTGEDEVFQKLPSDSGYQNVTFAVDVNICPNPSNLVSEFTSQYVKSINSGVLHLPSSYKETGAPTPLIIFLHGTAGRFTPSSTRFGSDNPYAPEWDAAGYAQLDVDMIPEVWGYTASGSSGTDDDYECVSSAYSWVIEHFNIARDGVYLIGRSRGGQAVMQILGKYNPSQLPVIAAISNSGANTILTYLLYRTNNTSALWNLFCDSHGLPSDGRPTFSSGLFFDNENVRNFLRDNINIWWDKAMTGMPMMVVNPTEYQSREEIFDLISDSYRSATGKGKDFSLFVRQCKFRSPVPLRFDWCKQDPTQQWDNSPWNYSLAVKNAFCDNPNSNAIYREWPTSPENPDPTAHFHELINFMDGDYKLPNGVTISNPSMARLEWLLWCQRHDRRFKGSVNPVVVE